MTTTRMTALVDTDELREAFRSGGEYPSQWGEAVNARRKALSVTRNNLAIMCNTSVQTIGRIETGQLLPRPYMQASLARALATQVSDLFPMPSFETIRDRFGFDDVAAA